MNNEKQQSKSIAEMIGAWWENMIKERNDKKKQARKELIEAQLRGEKTKELYRLRAQRFIVQARDAAQRGDTAGRNRAAQLLKVSYAAYKYMCSLTDTYTAVATNMDLRELTADFARTISGITSIKVGDEHVNFAALTRKALKHLKPADMAEVDGMFDELIRGSISATEAANANDAFLDALINGSADLDTPYPSPAIAAYDERKGQDAKSQDDAMMAMLDKMAGELARQ